MSAGNNKAVLKYLCRYAEADTDISHQLKMFYPAPIDQAIIIPACNESPVFLARLLALPSDSTNLWLIVLNAPPEHMTQQVIASNQCLEYLRRHCTHSKQLSPCLSLHRQGQHLICCVDLVQSRASAWQQYGVGFARKLAMDICLWLHHKQRLLSPFVRSSDADVGWPQNYLQSLPDQPASTAALLYPFEHGPVAEEDPDFSEAALIYDCWLRYYVAGLEWAHCPWAFHSIGSTLVINLLHYAVNRGFPKCQAGEDFYLLNKLAKTGNIINLPGPTLMLSNRQSLRTPFGTGKAIHTMETGRVESWRFYHPEIFRQLRYWYQHQAKLFQQPQLNLPAEADPISQVLKAMGMEAHLAHCARISQDAVGFSKQLNSKMDASMVRKCVHQLRDQYFGSLNLSELFELTEQGKVAFIDPPAQPTVADLKPANATRRAATQLNQQLRKRA